MATSGVNLAISGLASGFDWQSLITQLAQAERAPEAIWQKNQSKINSTNSAFTVLKSYLSQMQSVVDSLKDPTLYQSRTASSSSPSVATAASSANGTTGSFAFNISQLATAASQTGAGNVSSVISPDGNLNNVTVGAANFATSVSAGTFTINGAQVNVATTDSLQTVFDNIAAATGNAVTASYNQTTDKITLASSSAITLGSAADTSNFLQVARLYNNSSGSITSTDRLGRVNTGAILNSADLQTPVSDGGSGNGAFTINGVTVNF
ncbi:MAG TPA: flagellar cap protein FliD N-terminal domain-containing protein, partial [Verrucomicrobiae bacterium]